MSKGFTTKETILKTAFELTSKFGLESLSIGELAKSVGMSKSGLFSHFKSKEKLQLMVMDYAAENFTLKVVRPALAEKRGIARIEAMMNNWKKWSSTYLPGGCPFLSAIVEFDDRPGLVRDHIKKLQSTMVGTFSRSMEIAIEENEIIKGTDTEQIAYELYSNMIGFHIYNRLLKDNNAVFKFENSYSSIIERVKVKVIL
jgi:AcrR family transcriptional regulator